MELMNNVLLIVFMAISVFLAYQFLKVSKKIKIKAKRAGIFKIILLGTLLVLNVLTLVSYQSFVDIIRVVVIGVVILLFMALRDGIGEEGVVISNSFIPYQYVSAYDYAQEKKYFKVYIEYRDDVDRQKNRGPYIGTIEFSKEKDKEVIELLQNKLIKKYKRMKKS